MFEIKSENMLLIKFKEKQGSNQEYYIPPEDVLYEIECLDELGSKNVEIIDRKGNIIYDELGFLPLDRGSVKLTKEADILPKEEITASHVNV